MSRRELKKALGHESTEISMSPTHDRLNRPLRDLRISVTDHCNLRCGYCLPAEVFGPDFRFLPSSELLSFDEINRLVKAALPLGIHKIRLTGGEPLLRPHLPELIETLRSIAPDADLALTTNGLGLAKQLENLQNAGLRRINISLDATRNDIAKDLAGAHSNSEKVWAHAIKAKQMGLRVKINSVIQRGRNESEILPLARLCRGEGIPLRFIEFMDVGNSNHWNRDKVVSGAEILNQLREHFSIEPIPPEYPGEVARRFRYCDGSAELGFINSITQPFCAGCSRFRVAANGTLLTCLFSDTGPSLKDWLRVEKINDTHLQERLQQLWLKRADRYSEERASTPTGQQTKPEMWTVGG